MTHWLLFVFLGAAWGGSFLFMRQAAPHFGALPLAGLRLGLASLLLLAPAWAARRALKAHWKDVALLGLFNGAIPFSLFAWSLEHLHAGHGSILNATTPLWVAFLGQAFYGQPQPRRVWLGLSLGILGVAISLEPWKTGVAPQLLPTAAALGATLCYGYSAYVMARLNDLPLPAQAWCNTGAGFFLLLLPALFQLPEASPPPQAWWAGIMLGLVSTGLAWLAFMRLFRAWGALRSSLVTFLVPFFAMLWGVLILHEGIRPGWWPGLALVLSGLALVKWTGKAAP